MNLSNNTTSLQNILDTINNLPNAGENLDAELSTQDTLIAAIMTALEGKSAGGAKKTVSITMDCSPGGNARYYDADGKFNVVYAGESRTAEVLGGIVKYAYGVVESVTGDYVKGSTNGTTYVFFSDGGLIRVASDQGGSN